MRKNNQQSAIEPINYQSSPSAYPELTRNIYRTCPVCAGCSFEEAKQFTNLTLCETHDSVLKKFNAKVWQADFDKMNEQIEHDEILYEGFERRCAANERNNN